MTKGWRIGERRDHKTINGEMLRQPTVRVVWVFAGPGMMTDLKRQRGQRERFCRSPLVKFYDFSLKIRVNGATEIVGRRDPQDPIASLGGIYLIVVIYVGCPLYAHVSIAVVPF